MDKLFREKNAGICKNYAEALRIVKGDRFVVLNGDDLFSPYNLFGVTDLLDEYDIVCTAFIKFTGSGDMIRSYPVYLEVVLQNFYSGKYPAALHQTGLCDHGSGSVSERTADGRDI